MNHITTAIQQLESHRVSVERALEALRALEEEAPQATPDPPTAAARAQNFAHTSTRAGMTPAGRRKLSQSMKKRWAKAKAAGLTRVA